MAHIYVIEHVRMHTSKSAESRFRDNELEAILATARMIKA